MRQPKRPSDVAFRQDGRKRHLKDERVQAAPDMPRLPKEIIEHILLFLPARQCFRAAVSLRYIRCRDIALAHMPELTIDSVSRKGQADLLRWCFATGPKMGLAMEHSEDAINFAGSPEVLDFWIAKGYEEHLDADAAFDHASTAPDGGGVPVLEWLKRRGVVRTAPTAMFDRVRKLEVLRWWEQNRGEGYEYSYTVKGMNGATSVPVLDWYKSQGPKYTKSAMRNAEDPAILDWWLRSGLKLKWPRNMLDGTRPAHAPGSCAARWWKENAALVVEKTELAEADEAYERNSDM
ncbi:hypothetical protein HDU87_005095 [Geranomyces variabilis]|uniref:F-box domain-containing protein n=1 Tax=Geranomyces variabilis TaxID=109894 RepID=A0AAD5TQM1_9FUNG|nr:hypothetical protein HDU87_005095 [Geranomyces variabilis]